MDGRIVEKYSKAEVQFEHPAKGEHHCGECRHFEPPMNCTIVDGFILSGDWCNKFEAKRMAKVIEIRKLARANAH